MPKPEIQTKVYQYQDDPQCIGRAWGWEAELDGVRLDGGAHASDDAAWAAADAWLTKYMGLSLAGNERRRERDGKVVGVVKTVAELVSIEDGKT